MNQRTPAYLRPYHAVQGKAKGIKALLWSNSEAQRSRFAAIVRNCPLSGRSILDAGCGRADLLGYLRRQGILPSLYTGIDVLPSAIEAARRKRYPNCTIINSDFIKEPEALQVGAEVIIFCGSLNTLSRELFYRTLRRAWSATQDSLVFNFLSSPARADAKWLTWHQPAEVLAFAQGFTGDITIDNRYLDGDHTVVMRK